MTTLTDNWYTFRPGEGSTWSYRDLGIPAYTPQLPPSEPILPSVADAVPPASSGLLTGEQYAASVLLSPQQVRGIQPTEYELYLADLQRRASTQADIFAELLLRPVGGVKKAKSTLKGVARQLVKRAQLARYLPGVGIAVEVTADAAAMLDIISEAAQESALGRMRYPGYRTKQGPQTRPRNTPRVKPQTKRASSRRSLPRLDVEPSAIPTPTPAPTISAPPQTDQIRLPPSLESEQPPKRKPKRPPNAIPSPKPKRAARRPPFPFSYRNPPTPGRVNWRTWFQSLAPGGIGAVETLSSVETEPLTAPQSEGAESPPGRCECEKPPKRKRKRKPRDVCYRGTYTETAKGLRKHRREKIPCQ